jgi:hypothetical protein
MHRKLATCVRPVDILALAGLVFTGGKEPLIGSQSLISPSPFMLVKMMNYRAPYRRLAKEAGLFQ